MWRRPALALVVMSAAVAALVEGVRRRAFPLGVPGEWEWLRVPFGPSALDLGLAACGVAAYAVFAGALRGALGVKPSKVREALAVSGLALAAVAVQLAAQTGAPEGYGLAKWVLALSQKGSSGYFSVAREEVDDLGGFLARYPEWIAKQDALHIGTHPPGLIASESWLLRFFESRPDAARGLLRWIPSSVGRAFRVFGSGRSMTLADRATLAATGMLTLLACASTVVPLYLLARAGGSPGAAFSAAAIWPLVPSAVLFQPAADTAFPLLTTSAMAFAASAARAKAGRAEALSLALLSGLVLGVGMQFSLVFLAVGLVVAVLLAEGRPWPPGRAARLLLATAAGFLAITLAAWLWSRANPFVIWWWNQKHHARFYAAYPRSYLAWVAVNPIELAVGMSLPAAGWALWAVRWPNDLPRVAVATGGVLAFLTLGGRNLSEVGRLWLPLIPALLVASGYGLERCRGGAGSLAATALLVGLQTLALQAMIQVVYPV